MNVHFAPMIMVNCNRQAPPHRLSILILNSLSDYDVLIAPALCANAFCNYTMVNLKSAATCPSDFQLPLNNAARKLSSPWRLRVFAWSSSAFRSLRQRNLQFAIT